MVYCLLVAATEAAKAYKGPYGPDIFLSGDNKLGRNPVQSVGGYQLPQSWQQVSGNHCRVYSSAEAPEQWFLEDLSTNGTHLEKKKVKKNTRVPLAFGQRITLSFPQAGAPATAAIEYIFQEASSVSEDTEAAVAAYCTQLRKRKQAPASQQATKSPVASKAKVQRTNEPAVQSDAAVKLAQQLKATEKEHAKALLAERAKQDALQKQMQDTSAAHAAAVKTLEDKLHDAEGKARDKLTSQVAANEAAIKAARLAAKESKAAAVASEDRLTVAAERAAAAEQQVSDLQAQRAKLEERERVLTNQLSKAEQECSSLQASHSRQQQETNRLLRQAAAESDKLASANRTIQGQAEQLEAEAASAAAAQQHARQADEEGQAAQAQAGEERAARHAAEQRAALLQRQLAEAQGAQQAAEERERGLRREVAVKQDLLADVRNQFQGFMAEHAAQAEVQAALLARRDSNHQAGMRLQAALAHASGADSSNSDSVVAGNRGALHAAPCQTMLITHQMSQQGDADRLLSATLTSTPQRRRSPGMTPRQEDFAGIHATAIPPASPGIAPAHSDQDTRPAESGQTCDRSSSKTRTHTISSHQPEHSAEMEVMQDPAALPNGHSSPAANGHISAGAASPASSTGTSQDAEDEQASDAAGQEDEGQVEIADGDQEGQQQQHAGASLLAAGQRFTATMGEFDSMA